MAIGIRTRDLFNCKNMFLSDFFKEYEYPWQMLPEIGNFIYQIIRESKDSFEEPSSGVFVGKNVKISGSATICPPCIICNDTEIRPGAYIRGNVIIGEGCVIGNSSELKNCILLDKAQVPHYNYIGDSILGNHSHLGAGSICSNLKNNPSSVVIYADEVYQTNFRKVGAFLGDGADVGCGCVLNPGTVIGKNTTVYPLLSLRGVFRENCIVKKCDCIVNKEIL